jgi:hypothetical protein
MRNSPPLMIAMRFAREPEPDEADASGSDGNGDPRSQSGAGLYDRLKRGDAKTAHGCLALAKCLEQVGTAA